jgi:hypothetical protein
MPRKASDKGDTKEKEMPTNDNLVLKEKITIGFCVAIAAVLIIMEGYVIMRLPDQFLLIGFLVIPLAIDIYVMVNSVINLSLINKKEEREKFDELYRAEKASYIIIRKSFEELQDRLNDLEASNGLPADDIINVQKAVAKVSINRNKENAMALMDSNNRLIEQIEKLEAKLQESNQNIRVEQEKLIGETREDLLKRNQDLERQLNRLEDVLRNSSMHQPAPMPQFYQPVMMPGMMPQAAMQQNPMQQPVQPVQIQPTEQVRAESSTGIESDDLATLAFQDEKMANDDNDNSDPDIPDISLDFAEENSEDPESGIVPDIDLESLEPIEETVTESEVTPEDIPDTDTEPIEDISTESEVAQDITQDIAQDITQDITQAAEPAVETDIDIPQLSDDPNHKMTPDEIAMMFASVDDSAKDVTSEPDIVATSEESEAPAEAVKEDIVSATEEPQVSSADMATAEKSDESEVTPLYDDPNHKLTADEIAKMFAAADNTTATTEPAKEQEATKEEAPVSADAVSADPNKIMTPEEIEKLFANL